MRVYFISGLGADKRAFYKTRLPDGFEAVYLDWIPPQKNEPFSSYAKRFAKFIEPGEDFILIGLSFGGMLASELSKIISPKTLIIISSLASYHELPWYFKLAGKLRIQKVLPPSIYRHATLLNRFMGPGNREMKAIVYSYVKNTDPEFIKWSLNVIVNWAHTEKLPNLVHIHGSKDHLLPCKFVKADYVVEKGGHLMVMNKAEEVNQILKKVLINGSLEHQ